MLALQIMLGIYGVVIVVALLNWLVMPRLNHWLMRHGARDPQWLNLNDEPPGFKEIYRRDDAGKKR
ncbi:MAG: hypothetical protein ABL985_17325 [Casimicrobium sp.]